MHFLFKFITTNPLHVSNGLFILRRQFTIHAVYDIYVVGSKSFRPDIQKPRQMENAVRDI